MTGFFNIGETLRGYLTVIDIVAIGGQYVVAKATDERTGAHVAIKKLAVAPGQRGYDEQVARCKREAHIQVNHPGVANPCAFWEENNECFIAVPFIEGPSLQQFLNDRGRGMHLGQGQDIVSSVADALGAIHRSGIIHRDIKPDNIIMQFSRCPVILDFGIAKVPDGRAITHSEGILGSLDYMSPEQLIDASRVDHRADLFSLGAVAYRIMTGRTATVGNSEKAVMESIAQWTPPSPRTIDTAIPPQLDEACMRLLAKRPQDRFQTAEDFLAAWNAHGHLAHPGSAFCASCGASLRSGAKYCPACGAQAGFAASTAVCMACGGQAGDHAICPRCRRLFSPCNHQLAFVAGSMAGQILRIPQGSYEVGREELSPRDAHISRRHVHVTCSNGTVHMKDAGSTNKTYVAGSLADHPIQLATGVEILIAGNVATYSSN